MNNPEILAACDRAEDQPKPGGTLEELTKQRLESILWLKEQLDAAVAREAAKDAEIAGLRELLILHTGGFGSNRECDAVGIPCACGATHIPPTAITARSAASFAESARKEWADKCIALTAELDTLKSEQAAKDRALEACRLVLKSFNNRADWPELQEALAALAAIKEVQR